MSRLAIKFALALAALTIVVGVARGDDFWDASPEDPEAAEAEAEYQRWMAQADSLTIEIGQFLNEPPKTAFERRRYRKRYRENIERAVVAYEKAAAARPDEPEPYYRAAELIYRHKLDQSINTPVIRDRAWAERGLAHWNRFEELSPLDPRVTETYFKRALVNTKMADEPGYLRAIANYEALLRRSDLHTLYAGNANIWLGNLAETYMMVGRLDESIRTYERALDFADRAITAYGLAVALDRAEEGVRAREVMRNYAEFDDIRNVLSSDVFFVPHGEVEYYLALGYEAMGQLELARKHYKAFIDSGAHPRYQPRARENLAWVDAEIARQKKKPRVKVPVLPRRLDW